MLRSRPSSETDMISIKYDCYQNGERYDTSGNTAVITQIADLIPGWQEAVMLMQAGDLWEICVPWWLAYGAEGLRTVGPFSTCCCVTKLTAIMAKSDPENIATGRAYNYNLVHGSENTNQVCLNNRPILKYPISRNFF